MFNSAFTLYIIHLLRFFVINFRSSQQRKKSIVGISACSSQPRFEFINVFAHICLLLL